MIQPSNALQPQHPKSYVRQLFRRYVTILLTAISLIVGSFVCGSVLLMQSAFYLRTSLDSYDALADQRFSLSGARYQVLVIGDSSALTGILPADVKRKTGLDTYNAALYAFSGLASYDLLLERYLKQNAVPELVVLYVTPRLPAEEQALGAYERSFVIFRYGSLLDIARQVAAAPGSLFHPEVMLRNAIWSGKFSWRGGANDPTIAELVANRGYLADVAPSIGDDCYLDSQADVSNKGALEAFRLKWKPRLPDFAIYIAPMAECDRAYSYYAQQYRDLADNRLSQLPGHVFADYTHATVAGAHETSNLFAQFVAARRQNWK